MRSNQLSYPAIAESECKGNRKIHTCKNFRQKNTSDFCPFGRFFACGIDFEHDAPVIKNKHHVAKSFPSSGQPSVPAFRTQFPAQPVSQGRCAVCILFCGRPSRVCRQCIPVCCRQFCFGLRLPPAAGPAFPANTGRDQGPGRPAAARGNLVHAIQRIN